MPGAGLELRGMYTKLHVDRKELDALPGSAKKTAAALKAELAEATKGAKAMEKQLGLVSGALGKLGPVGQIAGQGVDQMNNALSHTTLAGGIALGSLVAIAGAAMYAEGRYEALVGKIDNYQDITSSSAEQASRMVHTLDVLGVSTDTAGAAMFKLSKTIAETPEKLTSLGIAIAKTADGGVDLTETLYNVSDAYVAASDSSARTTILFAAFGKGGAAMIDVVERGSDSLRKLAESAKLVVTDDDISRLREYKIRQEQLQSNWDEWVASLGQKVVPVLDEVTTRMNKNDYVVRRLSEAVDSGTLSWGDYQKISLGSETAGNGLLRTLRGQYDASQKLAGQNSKLTQTIKDQTDKNNELVKSMNDVIGGLEAEHNSAFALVRADLAVSESGLAIEQAHMRQVDAADNVRKAWDALVIASRDYGKNSEEARLASDAFTKAQLDQRATADDVTKAELDQEQAYYAAAAAARKLQEDTDLATTGQKDAGKETEVYVAKLQAEADALAPDSSLRKRLQEYIDKLKGEIPASVTTKFLVEFQTIGMGTHPGGHGNVYQFAEGGRPPVGRDVWVGENGPELARFDSPATIYPTGQAPSAAASDMSRVEGLLQDLVDAVTAEPSGQTGTEAALWKAMQGASLNRIRGMASA